jgi:hypothetical protein
VTGHRYKLSFWFGGEIVAYSKLTLSRCQDENEARRAVRMRREQREQWGKATTVSSGRNRQQARFRAGIFL